MKYPSPEFDDIVAAVCHGSATEQQLDDLAPVLASDAAARDEYLARVELHTRLATENGLFVSSVPVQSEAAAGVDPSGLKPGRRQFLPWIVATAASVVAAVSLWYAASTAAPVEAPPVVEKAKQQGTPAVAVLVNEIGAKFADGEGPDADRFETRKYRMLAGAAHLRFVNGADVVINAPATFTIHDAMRMTLAEGSLRATIPETAQGFVVAAPGVDYLDRGTEFGVSVEGGTGRSELHVFDGVVDVLPGGSGTPVSSVSEGESVSMSQGRLRPAARPAPEAFPTADSIALRRWDAQRQTFRHDPDLVFYYPFVPDETDTSRLVDEATSGQRVEGRIQGAQWVTGRWPGKKALQFEQLGDLVTLNIPGSFDQFTIAAWVKVDRLEYSRNSILMTDGWAAGGYHWQSYRHGYLTASGPFGWQNVKKWAGPTIPQGRWVLLTAVVDRTANESRQYADSSLVARMQFTLANSIRPGSCRLGSWKPLPGHEDELRDFRGRIDEVAMWRRALSADEVRKLYEAGKPADDVQRSNMELRS